MCSVCLSTDGTIKVGSVALCRDHRGPCYVCGTETGGLLAEGGCDCGEPLPEHRLSLCEECAKWMDLSLCVHKELPCWACPPDRALHQSFQLRAVEREVIDGEVHLMGLCPKHRVQCSGCKDWLAAETGDYVEHKECAKPGCNLQFLCTGCVEAREEANCPRGDDGHPDRLCNCCDCCTVRATEDRVPCRTCLIDALLARGVEPGVDVDGTLLDDPMELGQQHLSAEERAAIRVGVIVTEDQSTNSKGDPIDVRFCGDHATRCSVCNSWWYGTDAMNFHECGNPSCARNGKDVCDCCGVEQKEWCPGLCADAGSAGSASESWVDPPPADSDSEASGSAEVDPVSAGSDSEVHPLSPSRGSEKLVQCDGDGCDNKDVPLAMLNRRGPNGDELYYCDECVATCGQCFVALAPDEAVLVGAGCGESMGCMGCAIQCSACLDHFLKEDMQLKHSGCKKGAKCAYFRKPVCDFCADTELDCRSTNGLLGKRKLAQLKRAAKDQLTEAGTKAKRQRTLE